VGQQGESRIRRQAMTSRLLFAVMAALVMGVLLAFMLPVPAQAKCKSIGPLCQPGTGCEPKCITTSDGGPGRDNMYIDDRKRRGESWRRFRESRREGEEARGRAHTSDMASGGTMHGSILVSPFVPGSDADRAWQKERKRRGLCGTDRLCLNQ
jgi:hypothetical protein